MKAVVTVVTQMRRGLLPTVAQGGRDQLQQGRHAAAIARAHHGGVVAAPGEFVGDISVHQVDLVVYQNSRDMT